ncbi:hypothetical protein ACOZ0W_004005 [Cronobacter dublinensis]
MGAAGGSMAAGNSTGIGSGTNAARWRLRITI